MDVRTGARLRIVAAAFLFSTGGAAIKFSSFDSWQLASLRSGVAALALVLFLPAARRRWDWRIGAVGAVYAATMILFVSANKLTTAANTIFLQNTAPLYLLLLGPWLLREPLHRRDAAFMAILGLGLALFFVGTPAPTASAPDPARGNWLALASGLCWALTVAGLRWLGRAERGDPGAATVVAGNVIACLVCLPLALPIAAARPVDWAMIVYLGVFQIGLAYVFLTSALRRTPALEAALLLLVEPVFNPLWAWLVQGERPGAWAVAGGALIVAATALKSWLDARASQAVRVVPPVD
jgi:drug/metabolite transporter (DMT)-like permease